MFEVRSNQLAELAQQAGMQGVAVMPGPNMVYLTGLSFHLSERPVLAFIMAGGVRGLLLPELEAGKAEKLPYPAQVFTYNDVNGPAGAFAEAIEALELRGATLGVEGRRIRFLELQLLNGVTATNADPLLAKLRMSKQPGEIEAMRRAVVLAEKALAEMLPLVRVGMSEREVAAEMLLQLLRGGSLEMPFQPIVASGPDNGANPHAFVTDRKLQAGDLMTLDWGATVDGYNADITRTFAIAEAPSEQLRRIYETVQASNAAGRAACRPGVTVQDIDRAARQVIEEAGMGAYFIHRTGHGLGLEGHEEPSIVEGGEQVLAPGMTFTVEPGIYIAGVGGVRIEDDVVVTADGHESLTTLPRELQVVG